MEIHRRRDWDENVFSRPNGLRENAEIAISCRVDLELPEREKEVYQ